MYTASSPVNDNRNFSHQSTSAIEQEQLLRASIIPLFLPSRHFRVNRLVTFLHAKQKVNDYLGVLMVKDGVILRNDGKRKRLLET